MKCPQFDMAILIRGKKETIIHPDCLKEECAWWDEELECCGEVGTRVSLKLIAELLQELVNKIPHAGQFLK